MFSFQVRAQFCWAPSFFKFLKNSIPADGKKKKQNIRETFVLKDSQINLNHIKYAKEEKKIRKIFLKLI